MHAPEALRPRVLLFDLGGVLAEFRGLDALTDWPSAVPRTRDEVWDLWLTSRHVRDFETGQIQPLAFAEALVEEMKLEISPERLLEELAEWVPDLLPGAEALLTELASSFRLALLSNTNDVHWPRFEGRLEPHFEQLFLSYRTGLLKPDAGTFVACARQLEVEPAEVLFFDDSSRNVLAARDVGLRAEVATSPAVCRDILRVEGWLR